MTPNTHTTREARPIRKKRTNDLRTYLKKQDSATTYRHWHTTLKDNTTAKLATNDYYWISYKQKVIEENTPTQVLHTFLTTTWQKQSSNDIDIDIHQKVFKKIISILEHRDSNSEPINDECAYTTIHIGSIITNIGFLPSLITKSVEGSIAFEFHSGSDFTSIEVFNDGEIVFLTDINNKVTAESISFEALKSAIYSIK